MKLRVEYDRSRCIGAGQCVSRDPKHFSLRDNKAQLASAKTVGKLEVLEASFAPEDAERIEQATRACPVNALRLVRANEEVVGATVSDTNDVEELTPDYNDETEFSLDPKGYFLIRTNVDKRLIEVAFCSDRNKISHKISGQKPLEIYMTLLKHNVIDRPDHAAYLGRELQKAYDALQAGIPYVQDDELKFTR